MQLKKILRELKGNYTVGMKVAKAAVPEGIKIADEMVMEEVAET